MEEEGGGSEVGVAGQEALKTNKHGGWEQTWAWTRARARAQADDDGDDDNNKETFKFYCTFPVVGRRRLLGDRRFDSENNNHNNEDENDNDGAWSMEHGSWNIKLSF